MKKEPQKGAVRIDPKRAPVIKQMFEEDEIKRFNKFRSGVLGHKQDKIAIDVDVKNYTKYLPREGTLIEKRELLGCLKSGLISRNRKISLS